MAIPDHVVSGELIESAWGNDVVDELARQESAHTAAISSEMSDRIAADQAILARFPQAWLVGYTGVLPLPAASWANVQTAPFVTLPFTCQVLVTTSATLFAGSAGGEMHLTGGLDGTQQSGVQSSKCSVAGASNAFLVHQWSGIVPAGQHRFDAFGFASAAGNIERVSVSVVMLNTS